MKYLTEVMLIRDNNCPSLVWNFIIVDNDHWSWSKLYCRDKLITDQPIRFKNYGPKIKYDIILNEILNYDNELFEKLRWLLCIYVCKRNFVLHNVIAFFGWKSFENDKTKIYLCWSQHSYRNSTVNNHTLSKQITTELNWMNMNGVEYILIPNNKWLRITTRLPASRSSSIGPKGCFSFLHPKVKVKERISVKTTSL